MTSKMAGICCITILTAIAVNAADNSLGTWKRNTEKTKYDGAPPTNPITSQTSVREAVDGGVKVTVKGMRKDGTAVEGSGVVKYDGKFHPLTGSGAVFDSSSVTQVDANTFVVENRKSGGKYSTKGRTVISSDGKTMTTTAKGTDADGKPISFTIVSDKQ